MLMTSKITYHLGLQIRQQKQNQWKDYIDALQI